MGPGIAREIRTAPTKKLITLYSREFKNVQGSTSQEMLVIQSNQPEKYYSPYNYFSVHCSPGQYKLTMSRFANDGPYTEWLLRARRCIHFADVSGLKPIVFDARKHGDFLTAIRSSCNVDHPTVWASSLGTLLLLNEPYTPLFDGRNTLVIAGFSSIEVPIDMSPYCGGGRIGSDFLGTDPGTRSYLITKAVNHSELVSIQSKLLKARDSAMPWNDTTGVQNV
jgi:hypothetical protein